MSRSQGEPGVLEIKRRRYALVGTGHRAKLYVDALTGPYRQTCQLVALCDPSRVRMGWHAARAGATGENPAQYQLGENQADDFERMLEEASPETIVVTCVDAYHAQYIVAALEHGVDVVTEKPLAVTIEQLRSVIAAGTRSPASVRVTFNARYAPEFGALRRLALEGRIGKVHLVELAEILDTSHGADYFRRWHREMRSSGGLLVHKACHHFDLVNWWLGSSPKTVSAMGSLCFYGKQNADRRGESYTYDRYTGETQAASDPFCLSLDSAGSGELRQLYLDAEAETGYIRDKNVFSAGVDVEDTAVVSVRYEDNTLLSYTLVSYSPWEGMRVTLTGDRGRIELSQRLATAGRQLPGTRAQRECQVRVVPMLGEPEVLDFGSPGTGHQNEDAATVDAIFGIQRDDPFGRAAFLADGVSAALIGIAAERSIGTGNPIDCERLLSSKELCSEDEVGAGEPVVGTR